MSTGSIHYWPKYLEEAVSMGCVCPWAVSAHGKLTLVVFLQLPPHCPLPLPQGTGKMLQKYSDIYQNCEQKQQVSSLRIYL